VINKEERFCYVFLTLFLLQFFFIGCSNSNNEQSILDKEKELRNDSNKSLNDVKTVSRLALKTGSSDKGATWNISGVNRINRYVTKDGKIVFADGVMVEGECISNNGTLEEDDDPCFDQIFILEDKAGKQFEMQAEIIRGDFTEDGKIKAVFKIPFSLAGEGEYNYSIRAWDDLIIADPLKDTMNLPGHRVSLGVFDEAVV